VKDAINIVLLKYEKWNHEIVLEPRIKPTFELIYLLLAKELKVLKKYLDENLRKGYIRPSTFPAGYSLLFIPKKNGKLRLYIDYRLLNNIIVKNRYLLPRIDELLNRL
jgi:hypothetical protein